MLPIALAFTLIFARISSCYDSRISKGKYITIKNDVLAKLLIEKESFYKKGGRTLKKDRNKMSVPGCVFYLSVVFIILLFFVLHIVPEIPCEPIEIDTAKMYLYADTVNDKIPIVATVILLCSEFLYFAILLFRDNKRVEQKWIQILIYIVSIIMGFCGLAVILEMVIEVVRW